MWIVVVVESYYPSVFHFENETEAKEFYAENKEQYGALVHIAKVIDSHVGEDYPHALNSNVDWANIT